MTTRPVARHLTIGITAVMAVDLTTKLAASAVATGSRSGLLVPVRNPEFSLGATRGPFLTMLAVAALGIGLAARFLLRLALRGEIAT